MLSEFLKECELQMSRHSVYFVPGIVLCTQTMLCAHEEIPDVSSLCVRLLLSNAVCIGVLLLCVRAWWSKWVMFFIMSVFTIVCLEFTGPRHLL